MDIKKAEILFSDPQFVKLAKDKVNDATALEDLFKEKGLEINPDDLTFLINFINKYAESTDKKLDDAQLNSVFGGTTRAKTLFNDPQFVKLAKDKVNDANALKDLFKEKGLEINPGDLTFLINFINKHAESTDKKLDDTQLSNISGGTLHDAGLVAAGAAGMASIAAALYGEWKLYQKGKKDGKEELKRDMADLNKYKNSNLG